MEKETFRLVIETSQNGFLVYVNQDYTQGTIRPLPFVFESMKSLINFVELNFHHKLTPEERLEYHQK